MVILSKVRRDGFYSIAEPCIIFEFLAVHLPLDFCTFMRCFGCNNPSNPFINLRPTLILVWTADTLVAQERNSALAALLHIRTAFRRIACRALQDLCPLFVKLKICKDVRGCLSRQACCDQFYIFISCKLCVFCPAVCPIRHNDSLLFLFFHLLQMLPDKLAVTMVVLLILVLCYNGAIGTNRFFKIGNISPVLFPCFFPECCFRVRRVLHHGGFHAAVFFCAESAFFIFNNRLFRQTSDKQIILCGIMIVRSTQGKKAVGIR